MKKLVISSVSLLSIFILFGKMQEPEFLVTNCKYNPKNWELVKIEEIPLEDRTQEPKYYLVLNENNLNVKFINGNGKNIWTKTNLVTETDFELMDLNQLSYRNEIINFKNGIREYENAEHLTLIDPVSKRKVIVDSTGKETLLPENSIAFNGNGQLYDGKYYVFCENDYEDEKQIETDYPIDDSDYLKRYNYFPSGQGIALFKKDGSVYKEFEVNYNGYFRILAFDSGFKFILLETSKNEISDKPIIGYLLMTTDGKIIKEYSEDDLFVKNPTFSENGEVLIPDNEFQITVIDTATGEVITCMDSFSSKGSVTDKKAGIVIIPDNSYEKGIDSWIYVLDYIKRELIGKIKVSSAGIAYTGVNGDGTEFWFEALDDNTNKTNLKYYRMK